MGQIVITLNKQILKRIDLKKNTYIIGRHADCEIVLPDRTVSAKHARLVHTDDDCFLEDLDSTNGTLINNQTVEHYLLTDNQTIIIGKYQLTYRSDSGLLTQNNVLKPPPAITKRTAHTAWLEIISGKKQGTRVPLDKNYMTLGGEGISKIAIERNQQGEYLLHPVAGRQTRQIKKLMIGDRFEVCGITLQFHQKPHHQTH